jgi:asparagine N-glycosylation enzyme membrane subunit Stt3
MAVKVAKAMSTKARTITAMAVAMVAAMVAAMAAMEEAAMGATGAGAPGVRSDL